MEGSPTHSVVPDLPAGLFAGTAEYYARYRVPYPKPLLDSILECAGITGEGRLLDLACGTGQVAVPLASRFRKVWAVDQEKEMVEIGRRCARASGAENIRWMVGRAEDLDAPPNSFELVTVGSAFHRLHRRSVGQKVMTWLLPGRYMAVMGSSSLWTGVEDWQAIARNVVQRWRNKMPAAAEKPTDEPRETFEEALRFAGYQEVEETTFSVPHVWSPDSFVGYVYSLSGMSKRSLGSKASIFEAELRERLLAYDPSGQYKEAVRFYLILARKPVG